METTAEAYARLSESINARKVGIDPIHFRNDQSPSLKGLRAEREVVFQKLLSEITGFATGDRVEVKGEPGAFEIQSFDHGPFRYHFDDPKLPSRAQDVVLRVVKFLKTGRPGKTWKLVSFPKVSRVG